MNKFIFTTIVFRTMFSLKRDFKVSENAFSLKLQQWETSPTLEKLWLHLWIYIFYFKRHHLWLATQRSLTGYDIKRQQILQTSTSEESYFKDILTLTFLVCKIWLPTWKYLPKRQFAKASSNKTKV